MHESLTECLNILEYNKETKIHKSFKGEHRENDKWQLDWFPFIILLFKKCSQAPWSSCIISVVLRVNTFALWICPQRVRACTANTRLGLNRDIPPICKANYRHFILMLNRAGVLSYVDFIKLCHGELISLDLHLEMFLCSTPSGPFQRERCNHRILMTWHFPASPPPLQHKVVSVHQS